MYDSSVSSLGFIIKFTLWLLTWIIVYTARNSYLVVVLDLWVLVLCLVPLLAWFDRLFCLFVSFKVEMFGLICLFVLEWFALLIGYFSDSSQILRLVGLLIWLNCWMLLVYWSSWLTWWAYCISPDSRHPHPSNRLNNAEFCVGWTVWKQQTTISTD